MATAFVLIKTDLGAKTDAITELKMIEQVKEAHGIYGVYDIIARIEADNKVDLKNIIGGKVRRLNGVRSTITMIVL